MSEFKPITISEAKEILERESKNREFNFEQKSALQHATVFAKLTPEKSRKLVNELMKIENVNEVLAVKIADMLPEHVEDVRVILAKERFTFNEQTIKCILDTVEKYL